MSSEAKEEAQAASIENVGPIRSSVLEIREASVLELRLPLESSLIDGNFVRNASAILRISFSSFGRPSHSANCSASSRARIDEKAPKHSRFRTPSQ